MHRRKSIISIMIILTAYLLVSCVNQTGSQSGIDWLTVLSDINNKYRVVSTDRKYMLPLLSALIILAVKLVANNMVCALDFKKAFIELPCEIIILSLGYLTLMIGESDAIIITAFRTFLFFIVVCAMCKDAMRAIEGNANNASKNVKFKARHCIWVLLSYIMAIHSFISAIIVAMEG